MLNKIQISTNPQIAPDFPIGTPQLDKSKLEADSSLRPAYVCVSMPKNDVTVSRNGSEAVMQVTIGSFYFILFCIYNHTTKVYGKLCFFLCVDHG